MAGEGEGRRNPLVDYILSNYTDKVLAFWYFSQKCWEFAILPVLSTSESHAHTAPLHQSDLFYMTYGYS